MSAACPALLLLAVLGLFGLGAAGVWPARAASGGATPPDRTRPLAAAMAAVCAAACAVLLAATLGGALGGSGAPAPLMLAGGIGIALDPLNLPPLLIAFGAAAAVLAFGWAGPFEARDRLLPAPLAASVALALLAADALTLLVGLLAASLTVWRIAARRGAGGSGARALVVLLSALAGLLLAFDILIAGGGLSFAALRAAPPSGWRAALVLLAMVATVALPAGGLARIALPEPAAALLAALAPALLAYLLIRVLLDLAGPAQPLACGVPVLMLGIGLGLAGAGPAIVAPDLASTLGFATLAQLGLSLIGVGVVMMARAADQPDLAAFALAGTLVQLLGHAAFKTLLMLGAAAVRDGAGTQSFAALGGVSRGMPITAACLLAGALALAALPLSVGFVGTWALLQALFAAARLGGTAIQLLWLAAALAVGLIAALLAYAALRLVGVGLLGRPRTPRAAAAGEPPRAARIVLIALAGKTLALGVLPGCLFALAAPAVRMLTATTLGLGQIWLAVGPPLDTAFTLPLVLAVLLGGLWAIAALVRRGPRGAAGGFGAREVPGWADGYAPPPAWLPFGDPALQIDAASFGAGLAGAFVQAGSGLAGAIEAAAPPGARPAATRLVAQWRPILLRYRIALGVAAVLLALLALALIEAA